MDFSKMLTIVGVSLNEGIRYGEKERAEIANRSSEFKIGIEYEFHPHIDAWYDEVDSQTSDHTSIVHDVDTAEHYGYIDGDDLNSGTWKVSVDDIHYWFNMDTWETFNHLDEMVKSRDAIDHLLRTLYDINDSDIPDGASITTLYRSLTRVMNFLRSNRTIDTFRDQVTTSMPFWYSEKGLTFLATLLKSPNKAKAISDLIYMIDHPTEFKGDEVNDLIEHIRGDIDNYELTSMGIFDSRIDGITYALVNEPDTTFKTTLAKNRIIYHKLTTDNDHQVEIITKPMEYSDAVIHLENTFRFIDHNGHTSNSSGLHISISTNRYDLDDINIEKLFILLNFNFIHSSLFIPRLFVTNSQEVVTTAATDTIQSFFQDNLLDMIKANTPLTTVVDELYDHIDIQNILWNKQQSINLSSYRIMDGRIELRYFGGKDYPNQKEKILKELARTLHVMEAAYTDQYEDEYRKARIVYMDNLFEQVTGVTLGELKRMITNTLAGRQVKTDMMKHWAARDFSYFARSISI